MCSMLRRSAHAILFAGQNRRHLTSCTTTSRCYNQLLVLVRAATAVQCRRYYISDTKGYSISGIGDGGSSSTGNKNATKKDDVTESFSRNPYRQHSLSSGTLRKKLRLGLPTVGVVTGLHNDTDHVETLGLLGYDFLWADAEHSSANPSSVANLILAAERRGMPTLVRIGYGYQNIIGHSQKFLVAGAQGIILPQCESADDANKIVEAVKFPPLGKRGLAGERWNAWGLGEGGTLAERVETSNANSVCGVVVESRRGIDALDDILSVQEVDFVFVAPTDLSSDVGLHGMIRHPDVVDMVDEAGKRIRAAGVSSGMLALTGDDYVFWRDRGFQVMCGVAHTMFVDGAQSLMRTVVDHELSGIERLTLAALSIIASKLTNEEVEAMRALFESIDLNDNGVLSLEELDVALGNDRYPADIRAKIGSLRDDLFQSGERSLDWKAFLVGTIDKKILLNEGNIRNAYDTLKKTNSENATISDLTRIFESEQLAKDIMDDVDIDGDKRISFDAFQSAIETADEDGRKK